MFETIAVLTVLGALTGICLVYFFLRIFMAIANIYRQSFLEVSLRVRLKRAKTYDEWEAAALELDSVPKVVLWKSETKTDLYDYQLVENTRESLLNSTSLSDTLTILSQVFQTPAFAGVFNNPPLYSQVFYGTKTAVHEFIDLLEARLDDIQPTSQDFQEIEDFVLKSRMNFGRSALCCSGGASFSTFHVGVLSELLDADCVPEILCGSSGGAMVAASFSSRTDSEYRDELIESWDWIATRFWPSWGDIISRALFAKAPCYQKQLREPLETVSRGLSFQEAYKHTGKHLIVTTTRANTSTDLVPLYLDYLTAPDVDISSALGCSMSLPGIVERHKLIVRNNGDVNYLNQEDCAQRFAPFGWKASSEPIPTFLDGSLSADIPVKYCKREYSVKFNVVSQCNPHIAQNIYDSKGSVGYPAPGFLHTDEVIDLFQGGTVLGMAELLIKRLFFLVAALIPKSDSPIFALFNVLQDLIHADYTGILTVTPSTNTMVGWGFFNLFGNPFPRMVKKFVANGRAEIRPKLWMIKHRIRVERALIRLQRRVETFVQT